MPDPVSRRTFTTLSAGFVLGSAADLTAADDPKPAPKPANPHAGGAAAAGPVEAAFARDYPAPGFKPSWKNPQVNRQLVQDFVILAHSDLDLTKKLAEKYPAVLNGVVDWGAGDWESALGGASHMGRHDIAEFLLAKGARVDIFCAAMMGLLDAVRAFLTLQPKLIDAKGPHGFTLHFHAQLARDGGKVLDYLQSVKKVELRPNPFLKKPADAPGKKS